MRVEIARAGTELLVQALRERALLLMGTDLALGREGPLKDHMRVALHGGLRPEQIIEALFHAMFYVGAPGLVLGLKVAGEVLAPHLEAAQHLPAIPHHFKEGFKVQDLGVRLGPINHVAMAVKDWEKAAGMLKEILRIDAEDGPTGVYAKRCAEFLAKAPPANWDGVFNLMSK